uniref:Uncharacterized protein n=1 Tax=Cynoglossus semilaevis TaxID=244447 RepID=A0A3P8X0A8_CYNSE
MFLILSTSIGPLYISPDCKLQANRLYTTRECTVPKFFKRCAKLLTRLSERQECKVG